MPNPLSPRSSLLKQARRKRSQYEERPPHSRRYRRQLPSPTSPRSPLNSHARLSRAQYPPPACASSTEGSKSEELLKVVIGAEAAGSVSNPRPSAIAMMDLCILKLPFLQRARPGESTPTWCGLNACPHPKVPFNLERRLPVNICSCSGADRVAVGVPGFHRDPCAHRAHHYAMHRMVCGPTARQCSESPRHGRANC